MAYKKIQVKRGSKIGMPVLRSGEPGFTQDEKSLYVGDGTSNQRFLNEVQLNTRIDEKITPVTQSIASNVATLNQTINTKEETLNQKITDKVTINGESTNVNFISNEIVKDGLIESHTLKNYKGQIPIMNVDKSNKFLIQIEFCILNGTSGTIIHNPYVTNGRVIFIGGKIAFEGSTGDTKIDLIYGKKYRMVYMYNTNREILVFIDGNFITKMMFQQSDETNFVSKGIAVGGDTYNMSAVFAIYNRQLTSQEIQHNLSVLNNTPSINCINDYAISTDTDHITDRTGRVQDTINRVFYKQNCKEFTSNGEPIVVNNGMDGYLLSATLQGNTVKNEFYSRMNHSLDIGGITTFTGTVTGYEYQFSNSVLSNSINILKPNTVYTVVIEVLKTNHTGSLTCGITGATTNISVVNNGIKSGKITTPSQITSDLYLVFKKSSDDRADGREISFRYGIYEGDLTVINPIKSPQFGLASTQATIYNNNLKYSFYSNLEDKLTGKAIDLSKVGDVADTLEIKEDGSGVYTQNLSKMKISDFVGSTILNDYSLDNGKVATLFISKSNTETNRISRGSCICSKFSNSISSATSDYYNVYSNEVNIGFVMPQGTTKEQFLQYVGDDVIYYQSNTKVTTIPKELVPTILTQATNTFTFGDGVMATLATISLPVDRVSEMQKELNEIKALIQTPSNMNLTMNYIEDEYNKNQKCRRRDVTWQTQ